MYPPEPQHLERLRVAAPGWAIAVAGSVEEARREIADADAVLGNRFFLQSLPAAGRLRWMQSNSTGVDLILASPLARDASFELTDAGGVFDDEVADHALALTLALTRGVWSSFVQGRDRGWQRTPQVVLRDLSALVYGLGGIGRAVVVRLRACGAVVTGVCRDPAGDGGRWAAAHGVGAVSLKASLELLPGAGLVVVALPLTAETRGFFGSEVLGRLRDGAFIVNVARGALVDEEALLSELPRLGGAGLDVFAVEPLPPDHWAWMHPKVAMTPHLGRAPRAGTPPWYPLFEGNLGRYASGRPLLNLVDKAKGY
jgi:phosphoglycerate dehydrogenase-like enzyme